MDPFARALTALFRAPGSAAAIYTGADGVPMPIRIVRSQPSGENRYGDARAPVDTNLVLIQCSAVAQPARRDALAIGASIIEGEVIGGTPFVLAGDPRLDAEGMEWSCELVPA